MASRPFTDMYGLFSSFVRTDGSAWLRMRCHSYLGSFRSSYSPSLLAPNTRSEFLSTLGKLTVLLLVCLLCVCLFFWSCVLILALGGGRAAIRYQSQPPWKWRLAYSERHTIVYFFLQNSLVLAVIVDAIYWKDWRPFHVQYYWSEFGYNRCSSQQVMGYIFVN